MGRHKSQITLPLKLRPQILLNNSPLDEGGIKFKTLEDEIKQFQKVMNAKQPLRNKVATFQSWKKTIPPRADFDYWMILLKFLTDDHILFSEDRERIASSSGHNVDSWQTRNSLAAHQREYETIEELDTPAGAERPKSQPFHPALNQALWDRYRDMKQRLEELRPGVDHVTCDRDIGLYHIFLRVMEFLGKKHTGAESDMGYDASAPRPAQIKEILGLERVFSAEDMADGCEFCAELQGELNRYDPYGRTHALIWFFYLADKRLLLAANKRGYIDPAVRQGKHLSPRRYDFYRRRFLELQRVFPPRTDIERVTEIQQELFLMMTRFFRLGLEDIQFENLSVIRFYRRICEIADQRAVPDPAVLWSYPWGKGQKEEYRCTDDIIIYHELYDIIRKNPDMIKREKHKLENELTDYLAGDDDPSRGHKLQLLHELSSPSKIKTLDANGGLCYRDSSNRTDFFNYPVQLPKGLKEEVGKCLPRCIREYTALSLWQEYLAEEMKETALDMLLKPYSDS